MSGPVVEVWRQALAALLLAAGLLVPLAGSAGALRGLLSLQGVLVTGAALLGAQASLVTLAALLLGQGVLVPWLVGRRPTTRRGGVLLAPAIASLVLAVLAAGSVSGPEPGVRGVLTAMLACLAAGLFGMAFSAPAGRVGCLAASQNAVLFAAVALPGLPPPTLLPLPLLCAATVVLVAAGRPA